MGKRICIASIIITLANVFIGCSGGVSEKEHVFGEWTIEKEATCTEAGIKKHKCTGCGFEESEVINPKGHCYDDGRITKTPVCTEKGIRTYICTVCGDKKIDTILALGHDFDEGVITKNPTFTENGVKSYTCKRCGEIKTEDVIPVRVTGIELNKVEQMLIPGDSFELIAKIQPDNAQFKTIKWSVSDSSIANIDENGIITARKNGTVIVTVTSDDQGKTAECKIIVCPIEEQMEISSKCSNVIMSGYAYGCGVPVSFTNNSIHDVNIDKVEVYDGQNLLMYTINQEILGLCQAEKSKGVQRTRAYEHIMGTVFKINFYFTFNGLSYMITKEIVH